MTNPEPQPEEMARRLEELDEEIAEARKEAKQLDPESHRLPAGESPPLGPA